MAEKRSRRAFDVAFKLQVARTIREQGVSISQVCRDMNLVESVVRRWVEQYDEESAGRPGVGKPLTPEQQRIRQLELENRQLKSNNDLLKKHRPSSQARSARLNQCWQEPKIRFP